MGYVEKRSGKYRARYRDPLGRLTSKTFARKADAERFVREMETDLARGVWVDPRASSVPLATWAEEFLSLCRRLSYGTQRTYRRDLQKYVLPRFGAVRLGQLRPDEIEHWLNDELASGLAPSSVHRHYRILRRALKVAVDKQRLLANPCDKVDPPKVPRREMVFLNWDEVNRLAAAMPGRYRALIYLAVDSGMRWSELVGLRETSIDLALRKVRVTEQLLYDAGRWVRKVPKTEAGIRSITISSFTAELLRSHLAEFGGAAEGLVFSNSAGRPLIHSSFLSHYLKPAMGASGVECRFHDLRHTSVALAIASGAHPKAIQARMGHSSITVTLDRYGHLFPELDEAIAQAFNEALEALAGPRPCDASGEVAHVRWSEERTVSTTGSTASKHCW